MTHSLGLKADGTLWGWGAISSGILGVPHSVMVDSVGASTLLNVSHPEVFTQDNLILAFAAYQYLSGSYDPGTKSVPVSSTAPPAASQGALVDLQVFHPRQVFSGTWKMVDVAITWDLAAGVRTDGTLWIWGKEAQIGRAHV